MLPLHPIPADCRTCAEVQLLRTRATESATCLQGHPLRPPSPRHTPRTAPIPGTA
jgi:hypothetical protein